MRREDAQVAQFFKSLESAGSAEEALHCIVQPVLSQILPFGDPLRGPPEFRGRNKQGVDIFGCRPGVVHEAHDGPSHQVNLTPYTVPGKFRVDPIESSRMRSAVNIKHDPRDSNQ